MSIKIEDIRVGDKVTLKEGVVTAVRTGGDYPITIRIGEHDSNSMALESIAAHTPAPREFKPGDMVTWGTGAISLEFLAVRDGLAIMWNDATERPEIEPFVNLRHADPAPAPQEAGKERKKIERWVNVYPGGQFCPSETRDQADLTAVPTRIACIHVVGYEGDGL